ncbi:MAG: hypothetical protein K2L07_14865 [Lachnospiraceae bacterium]|nr:hypothetical protein [Lachnospiraceae bacterium]
MLNDAYVEQSVKAKPGIGYFWKIFISVALIVFGIPFILFGGLGLLLVAAGIGLFMHFAGDSKMEYEYTLTNGSVEIAAIYNASRRKEILQFDLGNVTMVVPKGSNRINPQEKFVKTYSFVSKTGEGQQVSLILEENGKKKLVTIEPNEKSVEHIKMFAKNKCYDI